MAVPVDWLVISMLVDQVACQQTAWPRSSQPLSSYPGRLSNRRQRHIRALDLPDELDLEVVVQLETAQIECVVRPRLVVHALLQGLGVLGQITLAETRADLADAMVILVLLIVCSSLPGSPWGCRACCPCPPPRGPGCRRRPRGSGFCRASASCTQTYGIRMVA